MSKLLLFSLLLLTCVCYLQAQVGTDPNLVHPNGLPVMVPSKSSVNYNSSSYRGSEVVKYHIPGTIRAADRDLLGKPLPPEEEFKYTPVVPERDTSSVYVLDPNGQPVRNMNRAYAEPDDSRVIPLFSTDTTDAVPYRSSPQRDYD